MTSKEFFEKALAEFNECEIIEKKFVFEGEITEATFKTIVNKFMDAIELTPASKEHLLPDSVIAFYNGVCDNLISIISPDDKIGISSVKSKRSTASVVSDTVKIEKEEESEISDTSSEEEVVITVSKDEEEDKTSNSVDSSDAKETEKEELKEDTPFVVEEEDTAKEKEVTPSIEEKEELKEKIPEETSKPPVKTRKPRKNVNKYGHRLGSNAEKMDPIFEKGLTQDEIVKQIAEMFDITEENAVKKMRSHLFNLKKKGTCEIIKDKSAKTIKIVPKK